MERGQVLEVIAATKLRIEDRKKETITFSQPLLWHDTRPVFFPRTINVIQGKAGAHKSRLAETICAAILKKEGNTTIGFLN